MYEITWLSKKSSVCDNLEENMNHILLSASSGTRPNTVVYIGTQRFKVTLTLAKFPAQNKNVKLLRLYVEFFRLDDIHCIDTENVSNRACVVTHMGWIPQIHVWVWQLLLAS